MDDAAIEAMRRAAETPEVANEAGAMLAADDLTAAFDADPLIDWFSRTDGRKTQMRRGFFRHVLANLALPSGQIMRPSTGGAAAVWMPSEKLGPNPLIEELRALPVLIGLTGWSRFMRIVGLRDVMDKHHPMETPHDYLFFLGVTPQAQGHGVGSRLIKSRLNQLDAAGRPAFLETATEPNVRLYTRHGFRVLSEWRPAPDGPVNWSMWRDPQPPE